MIGETPSEIIITKSTKGYFKYVEQCFNPC